MKPRLFSAIVRAAATDLPEGSGTELTPPQAEAPAVASEPPAKPTLLQLASAAVATKAGLIAEITSAQATISGLRKDMDYLQEELETVRAESSAHLHELATLRAERQELTAALQAATAEAATAEQEAASIVAALGVESAKLPDAALPGESREELMAAMEAEKDPAKRYELAARINALK